MITADTLRFLATDRGAELLAEAAAMPPDTLTRLTRLRRKWPAEMGAAAVEQLQLRERAAVKFKHAQAMLFTRQGLEQASGDAAAHWRAARFPQGATVLDLCCGIGGDAVALGS